MAIKDEDSPILGKDDFIEYHLDTTEGLKSIGHDEMMFCRTQNGTVLYCSPVIVDLLGYQPEECLGDQCPSLADTPRNKAVLEKRETASNNKVPILAYRLDVHCKDGTLKTLDIKEHLSSTLHQEVVYIATVKESFSKPKPPDFIQGQEQLRVLMDNIPGTLYICRNDENHSALFFGDNVEKLTGYTVQDFITGEICFPELYHPDDREMVQQQIDQAIKSNSHYHFTARIFDRSGTIRWIEEKGNGFVFSDGSVYIEGLAIDVTRRIEIEEEQREIENRYRVIFNAVKDGVMVLDQQGVIVEFNQAAEEIFGLSRSDALSKKANHFFSDDGYSTFSTYLNKLDSEFTKQFESSALNKAKSNIELDITLTPVEVHQCKHLLVTFRDITEQKHLERERSWLASFPELSPNPVMEISIDGSIRYINQIARDSFPEVINQKLDHPFLRDIVGEVMEHHKLGIDSFEREVLVNNCWHNQLVHLVDSGKGIRIYSFDVTSRKKVEERLRHTSLHDGLTGLSNRVHIQSVIQNSIENNMNTSQKKLRCLFYFDLDNFKEINDSLGHPVGDEVLVAFANKLKECFRKDDTISRLGGDEFAVFIENIASISATESLLKRFYDTLKAPLDLSEGQHCLKVSTGVAFIDKRVTTTDALLVAADSAMYEAKNSEKNTFAFYNTPKISD